MGAAAVSFATFRDGVPTRHRATLRIGFLEIVFVFLFIDLFDNIGTLVAVGKKAGLFERRTRSRASTASCFPTHRHHRRLAHRHVDRGELYRKRGGRGGRRPQRRDGDRHGSAVSWSRCSWRRWSARSPPPPRRPRLIIVGSLMVGVVAEIEWHDPEVAIPAFLTMMAIPLTFSIANGLAFGFTAYTLIKVLRGKFREVNWFVYVLTALFCAAVYLPGKS